MYRIIVEREQTYNFASGLNNDLDKVRGRTIAIRPLPHIDEVFAEVRREKSRKQRMLRNPKDTIITDNSAMAVHSQDNSNRPRMGRKTAVVV